MNRFLLIAILSSTITLVACGGGVSSETETPPQVTAKEFPVRIFAAGDFVYQLPFDSAEGAVFQKIGVQAYCGYEGLGSVALAVSADNVVGYCQDGRTFLVDLNSTNVSVGPSIPRSSIFTPTLTCNDAICFFASGKDQPGDRASDGALFESTGKTVTEWAVPFAKQGYVPERTTMIGSNVGIVERGAYITDFGFTVFNTTLHTFETSCQVKVNDLSLGRTPIEISKDGSVFISLYRPTSGAEDVAVYDLHTCAKKGGITIPVDFVGVSVIRFLQVSNDSKHLFVGVGSVQADVQYQIVRVSLATGQVEATLTMNTLPGAGALTKDGKWLTVIADGKVLLINTSTMKVGKTFMFPPGTATLGNIYIAE